MAWPHIPGVCRNLVRTLQGIAARSFRWVLHLAIGRRFMQSLELNREAADNLDSALKDLLEP